MITLSQRATRYLDDARARGELRHQDLRVVVRRDPRGSLEYALHWVEPGQALPGDVLAEYGQIRLHVEIHSAGFLRDATLDYLDEGPERRGFQLLVDGRALTPSGAPS